MKKLIHFFDKLEDRVRGKLSKYPILYALIGSIGIILLWRGIWVIGDNLNLSGIASTLIGIGILLLTGLFVSFFVGEQIIISGIKEEKRIDEKTEEEVKTETVSRKQMQSEIRKEFQELETEIKEIKTELDEVKKDIEK